MTVGGDISVLGKGTIRANFQNKSGKITGVTLTNVLHIPDQPFHLLSAGKMADAGFVRWA